MDGKGAAVLEDDAAKLATGATCGEPEHFERHVTDEARRHGTGEIGKVGLGQLVVKCLVGDRGVEQRIEATVEIREGVDALARTGRRPC